MNLQLYKSYGNDTVHFDEECRGVDKKEVNICEHCAQSLMMESDVYAVGQSVGDKQFRKYELATGPTANKRKNERKPPRVELTKESARFTDTVFDLVDFDFHYVNPYISHDDTMIGLKPVKGEDVGFDSLSVKGGTMSFQGIRKEIDIKLNLSSKRSEAKYFEVQWNEDNDMLIIDLSNAI